MRSGDGRAIIVLPDPDRSAVDPQAEGVRR